MTNTENNNSTHLTDKFLTQETVYLTEGITFVYQIRNKFIKDTYSDDIVGDYNSLIITTYSTTDSPCANILDIWNINSKDISGMISALTKVKKELIKQEEAREKIKQIKKKV